MDVRNTTSQHGIAAQNTVIFNFVLRLVCQLIDRFQEWMRILQSSTNYFSVALE